MIAGKHSKMAMVQVRYIYIGVSMVLRCSEEQDGSLDASQVSESDAHWMSVCVTGKVIEYISA